MRVEGNLINFKVMKEFANERNRAVCPGASLCEIFLLAMKLAFNFNHIYVLRSFARRELFIADYSERNQRDAFRYDERVKTADACFY